MGRRSRRGADGRWPDQAALPRYLEPCKPPGRIKGRGRPIPALLFGWASMGIAIMNHDDATVLVVLNALRLLRFTEKF